MYVTCVRDGPLIPTERIVPSLGHQLRVLIEHHHSTFSHRYSEGEGGTSRGSVDEAVGVRL